MLPPQSVPVGGRLCQFVEGWKPITSPLLLLQTPWEIRFDKSPRADFPNASEERNLRNIFYSGFYSNVFLVRKASGGWRPVIDLKQLNQHIDAPHFRMHTISSVYLQDAYFQLLIYLHSRKYLRFAFENKVYKFRVIHFSLNTAPHVLTCLGHTVAAYLHRQGISVIPGNDNLINHPDRQVLLRHQSQ